MSDGLSAPTSKAELLQRLRDERLAWDNLMATVPDDIATAPNLPNGWSVKDLMAHIAAYENWTAAQIRAFNEGRQATDMELYGVEQLPAEARDWDTEQINSSIYGQYQNQPLDEARLFAGQSFNELVEALERISEEDLLRPGALEWVREGNLLAAIPEQSYDHYAMHVDDLRTVAGRMA
jgi:hypothetical protein